MTSNVTLNFINTWNVKALKQFLTRRGQTPGHKRADELRALVYAAVTANKPAIPTADEELRSNAEEYRELLIRDRVMIPDPLYLEKGWMRETMGVTFLPPPCYIDMAENLTLNCNKSLKQHLLTAYKEGKAYNCFAANWLKEVMYHPISSALKVCFVKADCTPSENIRAVPHTAWVCIVKANGEIHSAYCSCFAG